MQAKQFVNCTLGELIRSARESKGLTRTKLAEFANITANSMVRYELAGTTEGKYPPVKKLVKICEILELDPRNAFDAIKYEDYLVDCKENPGSKDDVPHTSRFGMRFSTYFITGDEWQEMSLSVKNMEDIESHFASLAYDLHIIGQRLEHLDDDNKKNGPDQKDPSRSKKSKNNTEAVEAASTRKPGGTDEAV